MINITGIGNGKKIFTKLLQESNLDVNKVLYDPENFEKNSDILLVIYDGLYINKYLKDFDYLQYIKHVPIFITPHSIHVFGEVNDDIICCPYCMIKRITARDFNLGLYDTLFNRIDFKSIDRKKTKEFDHFIKLLFEMLSQNKLLNTFLNYNLLNNLYYTEEVEGLSKCSMCDANKYDQQKLLHNIKEI